ncbi:MAG: hypothetical protein JO364_06265 [Pseudonocardiales bacterium]|nr:hypothetical protein [Pseudonocardiales bacterium]
MINYLVQVLGRRTASGMNSPEVPTRATDDVPGAVFGDELPAGNGVDKAG